MSIPTSWSTHQGLFTTIITPITAFTGGTTAYLTEVTADVSTRNSRLSNNTTSAAVMSFWTDNSIFTNQHNMEVFTKSILGGYSELNTTINNRKSASMQHPLFNGMFAKDILEIIPVAPTESESTQYNYGNYDVAKVTISFESLQYSPGAIEYSPDAPYNPNWMQIEQPKASCQRISTPVGWYQINSGPFTSFPALSGRFLVQPTNYLEVTFYQVPNSFIFDDGFSLANGYLNMFGKVNSAAFAGIDQYKLLFDGMALQTWYDWAGNYQHNVKCIFLINDWKWTSGPDPAGNIQPIVFVGGTSLPFETFDINSLFEGLNPK